MKVKNTSLVKLKYFDDYPDGNLVIAEEGKNIPFKIKRIYYITDLGNAKAIRGKHAHRKLEQVIFCVKGSFSLTLDDGKNKSLVKMNKPHVGVRIGKLVWLTMTDFSSDCAILVLAADFYDEADYIRNYQEFLNLVKKKKK